jgi:CheY-like chemotaxis protein
VLVLDGDALVRLPVVEFLRGCGHDVVEAATTDEAIAILQKTKAPVDGPHDSGRSCTVSTRARG